MYANGQGVSQDYAKAMQWLRLAAQQGSGLAQANLGVMYNNGQGVPQDFGKAFMWYVVATTSGFKEADANMSALAARMTPTQIAQARQEAAEWLAARHKGGN
jgi:TPR repeat protein